MNTPSIRTSATSLSALSAAKSTERVVTRTIRGAQMACREWGKPGNPVLIGIHGLTSNSLTFADMATAAAAAGYHVICPDLRGRNLSPNTGAYTYGWTNHAADMIAIADAVGAKTFSVMGHSMGGYVVLELGVVARGRLDKAVVFDALGNAEVGALQSISSSINRIDHTYASPDEYVQSIRSKGLITPFTKTWDRVFREELEPAPGGGFKPRISRDAVYEDTTFALQRAMNPAFFRVQWQALPKKTLVVRAGVPLAPVLGNIITEIDAVQFKSMRSDAAFKTVDANHYTVLTEPNTIDLVTRFLKGDAV